jgi:urease accessory protein
VEPRADPIATADAESHLRDAATGLIAIRSAPLGNLASFAVGRRRIECVPLNSDDLAKRILRVATSAGDVGLRFAGADRLRDGDVIHADDRLIVAVAVAADDVLVLRPATIGAAIRIAHALGNRHLPIQLDDEAIVVRFDPLLEALAADLGVAAAHEQRVMGDAFRHANAPHRHD